ncbi:MAG: hypothetical protein Q4G28_01895 [Neisseria sp.]|nr:hypothetical protein [Neisseria sp.]
MQINLKDKATYEQELSFALTYQKRSLLGKIAGVLGILIAGILWILEISSISYPSNIKTILSWIVFGLIFFAPIHILIFGRCPKCKKVQPAGYSNADISKGVSISYTRGFTPFRKRCYYCGTYLSVKQLKKDQLKISK